MAGEPTEQANGVASAVAEPTAPVVAVATPAPEPPSAEPTPEPAAPVTPPTPAEPDYKTLWLKSQETIKQQAGSQSALQKELNALKNPVRREDPHILKAREEAARARASVKGEDEETAAAQARTDYRQDVAADRGRYFTQERDRAIAEAGIDITANTRDMRRFRLDWNAAFANGDEQSLTDLLTDIRESKPSAQTSAEPTPTPSQPPAQSPPAPKPNPVSPARAALAAQPSGATRGGDLQALVNRAARRESMTQAELANVALALQQGYYPDKPNT